MQEQNFDNQFYPTPPNLAIKAISKFKNRITRLLEPSAGRGDMIEQLIKQHEVSHSGSIDCIEIDATNVAALRSKKYQVIGHDFMSYQGGAIYSHILMNPPFNVGVDHVLQAWKVLFHGELVAIINAENIKNPRTKKQAFLVDLIAQHGSFEYLQDEFTTPETQRKTKVEVALVYLKKEKDFKTRFINDLKKEEGVEEKLDTTGSTPKDLIIPESSLKNLMITFNCAVDAMKKEGVARERSAFYKQGLGKTMVEIHKERGYEVEISNEDCFKNISAWVNEKYSELKERAWSSVMNSVEALKCLSSEAQRRLESEFENIRKLEFTMQNIYGFLDGLYSQRNEIQADMICDVFDLISKYHPGNRAYYQGWKSNTRHRINAFRIMMTRFILPCRNEFYCSTSLWYEDKQTVCDIDKVFALLDGKQHPDTFGVADLFDRSYKELCGGERLSCDYFEIRYFPKRGSIHFFPKNKELVDRLNRIVGQKRKWLPHDESQVEPGFWEQFKKAETIKRKMDINPNDEREINRIDYACGSVERACQKLSDRHDAVLKELGIPFDGHLAIENFSDDEKQLLGHDHG